MTVYCYPLDAVAGAPEYTGRALRETMAALLGGARAGRPLGGITGVRPGTPSDTTTISGLTWTLNPHAGVLDLMVAAEAGPYAYGVSEAITGSITAADVSNPRKGILCAVLTDPAESAPGTPGVTFVYTPGAAAGSPVVPATPALSVRIGTVTQPISGGGAATIVFDAPFTVAAGGILPAPTQAVLDTVTGGLGQFAVVIADTTTTNNGPYSWNGTAWIRCGTTPWAAYTPVWTGTGHVAGNSVTTAMWRFVGEEVEIILRRMVGTTGVMTQQTAFSLPVAANAGVIASESIGWGSCYIVTGASAGVYKLDCAALSTTTAGIRVLASSAAIVTFLEVTNTLPALNTGAEVYTLKIRYPV